MRPYSIVIATTDGRIYRAALGTTDRKEAQDHMDRCKACGIAVDSPEVRFVPPKEIQTAILSSLIFTQTGAPTAEGRVAVLQEAVLVLHEAVVNAGAQIPAKHRGDIELALRSAEDRRVKASLVRRTLVTEAAENLVAVYTDPEGRSPLAVADAMDLLARAVGE
jgi:hypothetical protein